MAFDFPDSPTVGQVYGGYTWDGEKWAGGNALGGVVRYDIAQTLDTTQRTQARTNIHAAPFDSLAYNGMQTNGGMEVAQETTSATTIPTGVGSKYIVDGWKIEKTGTSVILAYPILPPGVPNLNAGIQLEATTAQASIGTDYVRFATWIEGYRAARIGWGTANAQPVTIGFWARMSLTGDYRAIIYNSDGSSVSSWMSFTINASMVWQWVTLTFVPITTGTWDKTNGRGLAVAIEVASSATPNTVGATGRYAAITGVVVLPGIEAPSAARSPFIMRPYDQELIACKRYYRKVNYGMGVAYSASQIRFPLDHAGMRATPTVSVNGVMTIGDVIAANFTQSAAAVSINANNPDYGWYDFPNFSGMTVGRIHLISAASSLVQFDARL